MRTLAYSIEKLNVVPAKFLVTAHIQRGIETESLRQYYVKSYADSLKVAERIADQERIDDKFVHQSTGMGLPVFKWTPGSFSKSCRKPKKHSGNLKGTATVDKDGNK